MSYQNVLILNFPKISLEAPPLAPAILSAICDKLSIQHDFIDCNLEFYESLNGDLKTEILDSYAENFIDSLSVESRNWVDSYFNELADRCNKFDLIAISVFSVHSVALTYDFLLKYRKRLTAKIVVGGPGIKSNNIGELNKNYDEPFYKTLHDQNLIDYWILGEGEEAFVQLLTGDITTAQINTESFNSLINFDMVPTPNFEKFNLDRYMSNGKKIAPIEGSRGCVRKCTFCDINSIWPKFKYRDGEKIADEILFLQQKYKIDHFWFNDSLINGSMKAFRDFITHLAKHRKSDITWSSQAIVRSQSSRDRSDFEMMKASGCSALAVGLESFSEQVRFHMGKPFTDDDLDKFLNLAQEFNISIILLLIVGYPTETQQDIDHALKQLEKYSYLADDGTISFLRIGNMMTMGGDIPIMKQINQLNIEFDPSKPRHLYWSRGDNTLEKRIQWRIDIEDHARYLGYTCLDKEMQVEQTMLHLVNSLYEKSNTN